MILIAVNAFFAASEIAVISLNPAMLHKLVEEGDRKAERLYKMNKEPSSFLSTIQVGITFAGFLGSAFAADSFSGPLVDWIYYGVGFTALSQATLDTIAVIVITIILSFFTLIFGELVPKRVAMRYPYPTARFTSGVVNGLEKIMRPVVWLLSVSTNAVLKLLRINPEDEQEDVSEEEIKSMVDLGKEKGVIDEDEKEWIQNVFAFDDMPIKEIMTHRTEIVFVKENDDYEDIQEVVKEAGLSRFPVYNEDEDDVVGVLYARDVFLTPKEDFDLKKIMRKPYFVPEGLKADYLFDEMRKKKLHFAIAVDEYGGISGVVTMEDLIEAIVGNIYDEYDKTEDEEYTIISDSEWKVNGQISLEDLYELTKIKSFKDEDEEYETLSGLIFSRLNEIPEDGSTAEVKLDDCDLMVTKILKHKIEEVVIKKVEIGKQDEVSES